MSSIAASAEVRPRDFSARTSRKANARAISWLKQPRHKGRRLLAMCAVIALPAMAMPSDWHSPDDAGEIYPIQTLADYTSYTSSASYLAAGDEPLGVIAPQALTLAVPGPAASALAVVGSGRDMMRAQQCMTMALYYEAATESVDGQRAVAQVVLNRVAHRDYPDSVCGVVFQGSQRQTGCQFSFTCDGSLARKPDQRIWNRLSRLARAALAGSVYRPFGLATHYHTVQVNPYWAGHLNQVGTIGAHRFYRIPGSSGGESAFRFRYQGGEPLVASYPGMVWPERAIADNPPLEQATALIAAESATTIADRSAAAPAVPASGDSLIGVPGALAGQVRAEFANSGKWLVQP